MGSTASVGRDETVCDIRTPGLAGGGSGTNSRLPVGGLPTISDMALPDKVELVKHMRSAFLQKVQELVVRRNEDDGTQAQGSAPVRATDIDDLLYAQIEIDQLVEDLRAVQGNGPLSVADLTQGVEHMFSKYDTDGMYFL